MDQEKRIEIRDLSPVIRPPFKSLSTMATDGGSPKDYICLQPGRWMLGIRISKLPWIPLYTDADVRALFDANLQSKELEVVHLGCVPTDSVWFFKLARDGKIAIDFADAKAAKLDAKFTFPGAEPALIEECSTGEDVFRRLCDHYAISLPLPRVCPESHLEVLGKTGKPIKTRGYIYVWGRDQPREYSPANQALAKAIDECDPTGIRAAVAAGASLTEPTRNNSFPPLLDALCRCEKVRGKECVELLIKLGCPIEGIPGDTPTIIACCRQVIPESLTIKMLEIVLPRGINVNAQDRDGHTALFVAAFSGKKEATKLLMEYGADPAIKDNQGQTVVSLVAPMHANSHSYRDREIYAEILCTLTEAEYKPAVVGRLDPKLAAEMERLRACNAANEIFPFAKWCRSAEEQQAAAKVLATPAIFIDGKPARFERVGFYLNVSEWDDPGETTANIADCALERLEEQKSDKISQDAFDLSYKLTATGRLLGMRHLQFAGAPKNDEFLHVGCDSAIAMFKILAAPRNRELRVDHIENLAIGLLMAALAGRWKDFDKLCELAPARLATKAPEDVDDLTPELVNAMLWFISDFRKTRFAGLSKMEQVALKGRPKRPKQLLKIWQAVRDEDSSAFHKTLKASITYFSKQERTPHYYTNTQYALAIEESVMCLAAERRGMAAPLLDESLSDYLVTPNSITFCKHD